MRASMRIPGVEELYSQRMYVYLDPGPTKPIAESWIESEKSGNHIWAAISADWLRSSPGSNQKTGHSYNVSTKLMTSSTKRTWPSSESLNMRSLHSPATPNKTMKHVDPHKVSSNHTSKHGLNKQNNKICGLVIGCDHSPPHSTQKNLTKSTKGASKLKSGSWGLFPRITTKLLSSTSMLIQDWKVFRHEECFR